jgi:hypothetical protein
LKVECQRVDGEIEVARTQIEEMQSGGGSGDLDELQATNLAMKAAFKDLSGELKELVSSNRELAEELSGLRRE